MREMKDSGVPWIGEIPKDWSIRQASQIFAATKHPNNGLQENNLLSLSYGRIVRKSIETSFGLLPESFEGYNIIDKDTIVLRLTDLQNDQKSLRVGIATEKGIITSAYLSLRCITNDTPQYLYYLLHCFDIVKGFYGMGGGIRQGLTWDGVKNLRFYLPNQAEQQRIADFLDTKCAEIDSILEKTRASIEDYKKLKQSVITEAVTKGIRGGRPMKDSGVEWIGEIPEEWLLSRVKHHIVITNGSDPITEGNIPVYGSGAESFKTCGEYKEGPTVLIGRKGATLHIPHYIIGKYWNVDTAFDTKAKNGFSIKYFYYLACSFDYKQYISQTTLPSMTQSCYENMQIPVPSSIEQEEIAAYLDEKCAVIDNLIASKEALITELESYKKSLIYEYVTGKKEV